MTQQGSKTVMKFELMVGGEYQPFEIDINEQTFTGTEALLIDQHASGMLDWLNRWVAESPRATDVVLLAFLATRRAQVAATGTATVVWEQFAEQVRPYSLRLPGEATAPKANRSDRRRASRSGNPAKRTPTAKDTPPVRGPEDDPDFMRNLGSQAGDGEQDPPSNA